jgi:hypothetical protein
MPGHSIAAARIRAASAELDAMRKSTAARPSISHEAAEMLRAALSEIQRAILNSVHDGRTAALLLNEVRELGGDLVDELERVVR